MWDYGEGNRGPELAAVSIAVAAVSVLAVSLRSYTMATILKRFLFEDWLAVVTCLFQIGFCIVVVVGVSFGLGAHVDDVPETNRHKALIFKWAGQVAYIIVSTLVKFVVGIFLFRLCVNDNWQRITILVLLIIVGLFNVFYLFMAIFQCQPVQFYWWRYTTNPPVTGKCNGHALATIPTYFAFFIGIFSDLTLALLPATLIKGANLDRRTKISVCCVLALGSLASVATIARIPYAKQLLSNPDYLYNFTDLAIWSIAECGIAITASSLGTLRPLFVKWKLFATSHYHSRYGSNFGNTGLPIQNSNTVTVISASHSRSAKRNTVMSGTTALTGSTGHTGASGGLISVQEGQEGPEGIWVEKDIEMSVMAHDSPRDSLDKLEAEVDELILPGTARRKASFDRMSYASTLRKNSLGVPPRPPPLQTTFPPSPALLPPSALDAASARSSSSGHRYPPRASYSSPSSPQRRPSDGLVAAAAAAAGGFQPSPRATQRSPSLPHAYHGAIGSAYTDAAPRSLSPTYHGHQRAYSGGGAFRSPGGVTFSPPSFHLPTRLQHQSVLSTHSVSTMNDPRGTPGPEAGLSAPPRMMLPAGPRDHAPADSSPSPGHRPTRSLGGSGGSPVSPSSAAAHPRRPGPATASPHFPFPRQDPAPDASQGRARGRKGSQRVSAFLTGSGDSSSSSLVDHDETDGRQSPSWLLPPPQQQQQQQQQNDMPSPLGSHPPLSPRGNWL